MSIDVLNETDHDVDEVEFVDLSRYVLEQMRVHPQSELCIRFVDEATMTVLHEQWMDLAGPTDVMSFPMDELTPGGGRPDAEMPGPGRPPRLRIRSIDVCPAPKNLSARNGNMFSTATATPLSSSSSATSALVPSGRVSRTAAATAKAPTVLIP